MASTFTQFRRNLPVGIQDGDQAIAIIEQIGKRVVAIEGLVPHSIRTGSQKRVRGSGIVFKAKGDYYLQTADHCSQAVKHLLIKFHFDDENTTDQYAELSNNAFMGNCFERDKAMYHLTSITDTLKEDPYIPDLGPLVVGIEIKGGRVGLKGFVECFKRENRVYYCVHVNDDISMCTPNHINLFFCNEDQQHPVQIESCGPTSTCSRVMLNDYRVPRETKKLFNQRLPWDLTTNAKVVTISHVSGQPKTVRWGDIIEDGTNGPPVNSKLPSRSFKDVKFVKNDCNTARGCSGGAVVVIGKDFSHQLGYTSYFGMHHQVTGHSKPGKLASIGLVN